LFLLFGYNLTDDWFGAVLSFCSLLFGLFPIVQNRFRLLKAAFLCVVFLRRWLLLFLFRFCEDTVCNFFNGWSIPGDDTSISWESRNPVGSRSLMRNLLSTLHSSMVIPEGLSMNAASLPGESLTSTRNCSVPESFFSINCIMWFLSTIV